MVIIDQYSKATYFQAKVFINLIKIVENFEFIEHIYFAQLRKIKSNVVLCKI